MPFDGTTIHEQRTLADELVAARLRYARNQIAAGKWCRWRESDLVGNRCLIGWARHSEDDFSHISIHAILKLWLALPPSARSSAYFRFSDVARYNDTHTRHSVIRLLDRAIVAMETISA